MIEYINRIMQKIVIAENQRWKVFLGLVILLGAFFRFKGLTAQSLWLDEIHTMNEAAPSLKLSEIFGFLVTHDPHPPLYFLTLHFWFKIFGFTDFSARFFSALTGISGIVAIFFLGKEMRNTRVGLIAALLTAVNFFHIFYSHEARNYILTFTVGCVSFLLLIRLLKNLTYRLSFWYALATATLLYTHYYGFAILGAQLVIIGIFFLTSGEKWHYFKIFALAGLLMVIFYLPWLKSFLLINNTSSFWMPRPESTFFYDFFNLYFGEQAALVVIATLLILLYFIFTLSPQQEAKEADPVTITPDRLNFVVLIVWLVISYLIPYVRSLINVPMLGDRYTIVTLPAILLMMAIAVDLISFYLARIILLAMICVLSLVNLFLEKEYYEKKTKQQWKETVSYIIKEDSTAAIVSDRLWYLGYYLNDRKSEAKRIDSKEFNAATTQLNEVWIATGHSGTPVSEEQLQLLNKHFTIQKEYKGVDAWAQLYKRKNFVNHEELLIATAKCADIKMNPEVMSSDGNTFTISGWAFPDTNPKDTYFFIELKSNLSGKIYDVARVLRGDVADFYKNPDLIHSGFKLSIPKSELPSGEFIEVRMVFKTGEVTCKSDVLYTIRN